MIQPARLTFMWLLLATGSSGAAAQPAGVDSDFNRRTVNETGPRDAEPGGRFQSARAVAERYQGGLALVMRAVAKARNRDRLLSPRLTLLHDDIHPQFGWGEIRADNNMMAIYPGRKNAPWGMAVAPDHPRLAEPGPTLRTGPDGDLLIVVIRPDAMSQRWAGIFMVHEFSHLADLQSGSDVIECSAEHEAYRVEREAVNVLSDDRFDAALDIALAEQELRTTREFQILLSSGVHDRLAEAISRIERVMDEAPALSTAEREMRDGFYAISLLDRLGERTGQTLRARCLESERMLQSASKF